MDRGELGAPHLFSPVIKFSIHHPKKKTATGLFLLIYMQQVGYPEETEETYVWDCSLGPLERARVQLVGEVWRAQHGWPGGVVRQGKEQTKKSNTST